MRSVSVSRTSLTATAIALLVAAAALAPGQWSTALAQTGGPPGPPLGLPPGSPVVVPVTPTQPAKVGHPGVGLRLTVAANTFSAPVNVTTASIVNTSAAPTTPQSTQAVAPALLTLGVPPPPAAAAGVPSLVANLFEMSATALPGAGGAVTVGAAQRPISGAIAISPETLAAAGVDLANVSLQFFSPTTRAWTAVTQRGTNRDGTVNFEIPHFSLWAVVVRSVIATSVPEVTGALAAPAPGGVVPRPADTGARPPAEGTSIASGWTIAILAAAVGAIVGGILGVRAMARRR